VDLKDLQALLRHSNPAQQIRAIPGAGLDIPIRLLGSSDSSAKLAAALGLPYVFATQIGANALDAALDSYRSEFRSTDALERPHIMVSAIVIAADTDEQAQHLFTSLQQAAVLLRRGLPAPLPPPIHDLDAFASREEQDRVRQMLPYTIVGSRQTVSEGIAALLARTLADELMILTFIHDQAARHRSLTIVSEACDTMAA
jgi:luciferase family oxidoreductase group 1